MDNISKITRIFHVFFLGNLSYAKKIGVIYGKNCRFLGDIDFGSEPYLISMGNHVSVTSSRFITHDGGVWVVREKYPDLDLISPIKIGSNVFIGSGCTILPGTIIEDNVVIGAGSLVRGKLEEGVYGGVPAKKIKSLDVYTKKCIDFGVESKNMKNKKKYIVDLFN